MAIEKCLVKVVGSRVVCDTTEELQRHEKENKERANEMVKNKKKLHHLTGIGMDITKYHPTILRTMIDGGRNTDKIPQALKHQLINFANEAYVKGFNPALFGYNTTLHKFIKTVHNIPKRKYVRKQVSFQGGQVVNKIVSESDSSSSSSSSSESETDLDDILSEVEEDLKGGNIPAVKKKLKKYKHRIPKEYYKKIVQSI
tara:strand:+ start:430 stop:1029 length:600 start_codon:yes stop_codon:yes gene_type:complete